MRETNFKSEHQEASSEREGTPPAPFPHIRPCNGVQQFHKSLVKHYSQGGWHLYNRDEKETFCESAAPGLFDDIFTATYNDELHTANILNHGISRIFSLKGK